MNDIKPGDLAVVISEQIFHGHFCTALRPAPEGYHDSSGHWNAPNDAMAPRWGRMWIVDFSNPIPIGEGRVAHRDCLCYENWLRPIRPQRDDAQDETLTWKPVPTERTKETA